MAKLFLIITYMFIEFYIVSNLHFSGNGNVKYWSLEDDLVLLTKKWYRIFSPLCWAIIVYRHISRLTN